MRIKEMMEELHEFAGTLYSNWHLREKSAPGCAELSPISCYYLVPS